VYGEVSTCTICRYKLLVIFVRQQKPAHALWPVSLCKALVSKRVYRSRRQTASQESSSAASVSLGEPKLLGWPVKQPVVGTCWKSTTKIDVHCMGRKTAVWLLNGRCGGGGGGDPVDVAPGFQPGAMKQATVSCPSALVGACRGSLLEAPRFSFAPASSSSSWQQAPGGTRGFDRS